MSCEVSLSLRMRIGGSRGGTGSTGCRGSDGRVFAFDRCWGRVHRVGGGVSRLFG